MDTREILSLPRLLFTIIPMVRYPRLFPVFAKTMPAHS